MGKITILPSKVKKHSEYYVPPCDNRGHSAKASCRLPPEMTRDAEVMLSCGGRDHTGWQTPSDFYRWCIREGLRKIIAELENPLLDNRMKQTNMILTLMQRRSEETQFLSVFDDTQKMVQDYSAKNRGDLVRKTLTEMWTMICDMHTDDWKLQYVEEFKLRFSHWVDVGPKKISFLNPTSDPRDEVENVES